MTTGRLDAIYTVDTAKSRAIAVTIIGKVQPVYCTSAIWSGACAGWCRNVTHFLGQQLSIDREEVEGGLECGVEEMFAQYWKSHHVWETQFSVRHAIHAKRHRW